MDIRIVPAAFEDREVLANLLEKYDYEFSQYDNRDVNRLGLYGYKYLDCYWIEKNRWAFFIYVNDMLAGFAMVNDYPEVPDRQTDYSLAEFFVMYKYRRRGVGKIAVKAIFDMFRGRWQLKRHPNNTASVYFWDKIVGEYTEGSFELIRAHPYADYADGTLGDVFFFDNGKSV